MSDRIVTLRFADKEDKKSFLTHLRWCERELKKRKDAGLDNNLSTLRPIRAMATAEISRGVTVNRDGSVEHVFYSRSSEREPAEQIVDEVIGLITEACTCDADPAAPSHLQPPCPVHG